MLSETLQQAIDQYAIGRKIRRLRIAKQMGLADLGQHTGLSPALLSKLENAKAVPTIPTLTKIALAFGVGLEHFFERERGAPVEVVRSDDRIRLPEPVRRGSPSYHFECLDFAATERRMSAYVAEFNAASADEPQPHSHVGEELIYVMQGELEVVFHEHSVVLRQGDSAWFEASHAHAYRRASGARTVAIIVTAP